MSDGFRLSQDLSPGEKSLALFINFGVLQLCPLLIAIWAQDPTKSVGIWYRMTIPVDNIQFPFEPKLCCCFYQDINAQYVHGSSPAPMLYPWLSHAFL